jgi:hypothetical protein
MRRLGRAFIGFLAGYIAYVVVLGIFLSVVRSLGRGRPDTLITLFWPFAAPFLVLPSHWQGQEFPIFDNVCSLVGGLIVLAVAICVYRALGRLRPSPQ